MRRLTLLETVIQGLRAQFNNVKLEIFRDIDGYENPPTVGPFLTMELHGITISPCTNAKRPTLELAEARAVMDMAGSLPEPLKPYAFRRMFRMDRADAWVLRAAGKPCNALPWQSQKESWRKMPEVMDYLVGSPIPKHVSTTRACRILQSC